jgi:hypothetical protein
VAEGYLQNSRHRPGCPTRHRTAFRSNIKGAVLPSRREIGIFFHAGNNAILCGGLSGAEDRAALREGGEDDATGGKMTGPDENPQTPGMASPVYEVRRTRYVSCNRCQGQPSAFCSRMAVVMRMVILPASIFGPIRDVPKDNS